MGVIRLYPLLDLGSGGGVIMEEPIEILEQYIYNLEKNGGTDIIKSDEILKFIEYREIQAIKVLIKDYKTQQDIIKDLEDDLMSVYLKGITDTNSIWTDKIQKKLDSYSDSCSVVHTFIAEVLKELLEGEQ